MYTLTNRTNAPGSPVAHECDHGFCSICGMVWPCSWARRHRLPEPSLIPTPRLPDPASVSPGYQPGWALTTSQ
jgi:hypothetical protein